MSLRPHACSQTQGIFVENIVDDGAAHREGSLRVKDRILAVNDADLTEASKSDAIKVMRACDNAWYSSVHRC
jgi:C-terminal processing protease CtpA/Prc